MMPSMRRETVEQILAEREIQGRDGRYDIPSEEVVTLLVGQSSFITVAGIVALGLGDTYLWAESHKGGVTYIEYESLRGVAFDPKKVADRHAGFV